MMNVPITSRDIYKTLWECREFELSTLWQRSAMLGVFLVVTYTGYGYLVMNVFEHGCAGRWIFFNLLGVGLCCFGMIFAALWCMMLKGSKMWFETCEAALNAFREFQPDTVFADDVVRKNAGFGIFYSRETGKKMVSYDVNDSLLSTSGGHYSVSRVAIAIGTFSLIGWCALSFLHIMALVVGKRVSIWLVKLYAVPTSIVLALSISVVVFVVLKELVKSSSL